MRSNSRRFLAAILLTAAAGFALSQEASAPPPPPAPVEAKDSLQPAPAPAAANTADPSTFQGLNPPNAAATSALPKTIAGAAPAATAATVEDQPQQTSPQKKRLGVGSWILGTILILALIATAIRFKGGQTRSPTSIVDFTDIHPELSAAPVRRS